MTIEKQISHGTFRKYVTCTIAFSIPSVSHFVNFTLLTPLCHSLKIINYEVREIRTEIYKKRLAYM